MKSVSEPSQKMSVRGSFLRVRHSVDSMDRGSLVTVHSGSYSPEHRAKTPQQYLACLDEPTPSSPLSPCLQCLRQHLTVWQLLPGDGCS